MGTKENLGLVFIIIISIIILLFIFGQNTAIPERLKTGLAISDLNYPNMPLELNESGLNAVLSKYPFFILDCFWPGCRPCRAINVTDSELSAKLRGQAVFGRINIRKYSSIGTKYHISSYPTMLIFKDGKMVANVTGYHSPSELAADIKLWQPSLNISGIKPINVQPVIGESNPALPMLVTDSDMNFVLERYPLLVLDYSANWCEPCRRMNDTLLELSRSLKGQVAFGLMEEKNNDTKRKYNITSYPTILIFQNGKLLDKKIGYRNPSDIVGILKNLEPGLNVSNVKPTSIQAVKQIMAFSKEIPLTKPGENNPALPMLVTDSDMNFVLEKYPLLVLEGFAYWCGACKGLNITLLELSQELGGQVAFGLIDAEKNKETKNKYNFTSYPTILIFKDKKVVDKIIGNRSKSVLVSELKKYDPELDTSKVKIAQPFSSARTPSKSKLTAEQICANMTKSDKPLLEAFVVSRCPFGLQMQRIIANMISQSKDTENYLKVRYIGSVANNTLTSMHGEEEAKENLRQICIREEQPDKYWNYVRCYLKEGESTSCLKSESIDTSKLSGCINDTSRGLAYAQMDFDLANKFKITGSPTLLLDNKIVNEFDFATNTTNGRSPEALKDMLCCAFATKPAFCSKELNKTQVKTMFEVNAPTAAASQQPSGRDITLIGLGQKDPSQAMLITDKTISSAESRYPLLVVEAYANWCGFCKMMNVTIDDLSRELQGQVAFGLIDMTKNNETRATYNITAYPIMLIFKDGKLVDKVVGNQQKSSFVAKLKQIQPRLDTSKVKIMQPVASAKAVPKPKLKPT